jgi:transposase-like protein
MVSSSSPTCPSCGTWNVRVSYDASNIDGGAQDRFRGTCHACKHEWSEESP